MLMADKVTRENMGISALVVRLQKGDLVMVVGLLILFVYKIYCVSSWMYFTRKRCKIAPYI